VTRLSRGAIVWVDLSPTRGREQQGHRPALVICNDDYLEAVPDLVIVVPLTSVDRGWPHHVRVEGAETGLPQVSFAMTEQPRTISRGRITRCSGAADASTMATVDRWLTDFLAPS
jgi:mRNA interferase MazF